MRRAAIKKARTGRAFLMVRKQVVPEHLLGQPLFQRHVLRLQPLSRFVAGTVIPPNWRRHR